MEARKLADIAIATPARVCKGEIKGVTPRYRGERLLDSGKAAANKEIAS
jgi:hypothetical protein